MTLSTTHPPSSLGRGGRVPTCLRAIPLNGAFYYCGGRPPLEGKGTMIWHSIIIASDLQLRPCLFFKNGIPRRPTQNRRSNCLSRIEELSQSRHLAMYAFISFCLLWCLALARPLGGTLEVARIAFEGPNGSVYRFEVPINRVGITIG